MIGPSPKIYEGIKAARPEDTIHRITEGFANLGLGVEYQPRDISQAVLFSGVARIAGLEALGWSANGKGVTPILAKASAYAELAERFSTGFFVAYSPFEEIVAGHDLLFRGCSGDYAGVARLTDYAFLPGYRTEPDAGATSSFAPYIFQAELLGDLATELQQAGALRHWVRAQSLGRNQPVLVPYKFVKAISGSNGLAAGNSPEEAIVQGTCEVFERYAALTIFRNQTAVPTIDRSSIRSEKVLACLHAFESLGIEVTFKDFSLGNRIPVIAAIFTHPGMADSNPLNRDVNHRRLSVGASLNLEEALTRVLTEEVQGYTQAEYMRQEEYGRLWDHLPHLQLGHAYHPARTVRHPAEFRMFLQRYLTVGDLAFLDKDAPTIGLEDLTFSAAQDFQTDVQSVLAICASFGKDIYVVDHTHPVLAFPAVRVIVPGMSTIFSQAFHDNDVRTYAGFRAFFDNLWYPGLAETIRSAFREQRDFGRFVEGMGIHLSHYPYDYALPCRNYGMRDTNIYDILSSLCLRQSDFDRSRRYNIFVKEVFNGTGNTHGSEGTSLQTSRNPFLNQCKCHTCQVLRPSLTRKAIHSLITVG